jgi:hypothetical protein
MTRHPFLRAVTWLACLACLAAAVAIGLGTAWFWQAFGGHGRVIASLGAIPVMEGSQAIVIDIDRVQATLPDLPIQGSVSLTVKPGQAASGDQPADIFVGLASADVVDSYLSGATYTVGRLDGGNWDITQVPGNQALGDPASVPWEASARSPSPSVELTGQAPITLAVLNGDQSAPVDVRLFLVLTIVDASTYQAWAIGLAIAMLVLAWTFGYVAAVRLGPRADAWHD